MTDDIRYFFLKLKNPNFLAMKLLLDMFKSMSVSDDVSKSIVDHIGVLSDYNIRLVDSGSVQNSVYSEDDLSDIQFSISKFATEYVVCHEFGHLLLDIFSRGHLPDNYMEVNALTRKRVIERKEDISRMIERFRDEVFKKLVDSANEPISFLQRNPEIEEEYLKNNDGLTQSDFVNEVIVSYFCFLSSLDENAGDYNRIANMVDSIFHGDNPFYLLYGNDVIFPVLASHDPEYFTEDENGVEYAGFEEQFADYLVLRVYGDRMRGTVTTLRNIVGDEWFVMMDKYYEGISVEMVKRGKVLEYKG